MKFGDICNLSDNNFKIIFPKISKRKTIRMFKNNLLHYCDKERRLTENYEKVDDIPI
jgi:hypothetical protein